MAEKVMIAALVLFLGVATIFILAMFTHLRTLYRKLMERHAAVSLLMAAYITHENDKKLFSRIGRLSKSDLPEFVEDFREKLKKIPIWRRAFRRKIRKMRNSLYILLYAFCSEEWKNPI